VWINATSYLPVQMTTQLGAPGLTRTTFTWLKLDAANRALLVAPIPAGFRELPGAP
jgi:hypothetical protein